jgi:hypothetical protein
MTVWESIMPQYTKAVPHLASLLAALHALRFEGLGVLDTVLPVSAHVRPTWAPVGASLKAAGGRKCGNGTLDRRGGARLICGFVG